MRFISLNLSSDPLLMNMIGLIAVITKRRIFEVNIYDCYAIIINSKLLLPLALDIVRGVSSSSFQSIMYRHN